MSLVSSFRARRHDGRRVERAIAAASTQKMRDELVLAAAQRAGNPPRL